MKKQFVSLALAAVFSVTFVQQSSALNIPKDVKFQAKTFVEYQQSNGQFGQFDIYKTESGQLLGVARHMFRAKVRDGTLFQKDAWDWLNTKGEIIDGRADGNQFYIVVHYFAFRDLFPEGNYRYEGTVSPGGFIQGETYNVFNPKTRAQWSVKDAMIWHEIKEKEKAPPPPPPAKRIIKSSGKGKSNATYADVPAAPNPAPWVNYAGIWELYSGGKKFLMDLTQEGNRVKGTYKQVQGEGTADANINGTIDSFGVLNVNYQQKGTPLCMGKGTFKTALDSKSFEGSFTHTFPSNLSGQGGAWNGKKITEAAVTTQAIQPPAPQVFPPQNPALGANDPVFIANNKLKAANKVFGGNWSLTTNSGNKFTMSLTQNGDSVTGAYMPNNGKLEGTMDAEGRLTYRWSDERGNKGSGIFVILNGTTLVGSYGITDDPTSAIGMWSGPRQ
jgi:hypothetical protein